MRQHARAIDAAGAAGGRSMGAFDGALSLLGRSIGSCSFTSWKENYLYASQEILMIHIMSTLRQICAKDLTNYAPLDADGLNLVCHSAHL